MKKTKEEYLAMRPPPLSYERWVREVERAFSPEAWKNWTDEEKENYLDEFFNIKPVSLIDRWRLDAKQYAEEAKRAKSRFTK